MRNFFFCKMKIILVAGARPNFMKIAPLVRAMKRRNSKFKIILVHTGQHYDDRMSKIFFKDLGIPEPDVYLGVGSGTHSHQTGKIMMKFEKVLLKEKPDLVMVVGDVNSTLAAALSAVKLHIPLAHVEAGLRSYDRRMPEEINRVVVDVLSDYLFTPSPDANENLKKEGIPEEKIFLVGDVMVDTLLQFKVKSLKLRVLTRLNLRKKEYALLTLHRPSNVDNQENFLKVLRALKEISRRIPIVFPAHPRTRKNIKKFKLMGRGFTQIRADKNILSHSEMKPKNPRDPSLRAQGDINPVNLRSSASKNIYLLEPLGYLEFLKLMMESKFVMTDSGGIQEETTVLNIPCLTLRDTTERPITIKEGTNILVGNDTKKIIKEAKKILDGQGKKAGKSVSRLWDGKAADRIVSVIKDIC